MRLAALRVALEWRCRRKWRGGKTETPLFLGLHPLDKGVLVACAAIADERVEAEPVTADLPEIMHRQQHRQALARLAALRAARWLPRIRHHHLRVAFPVGPPRIIEQHAGNPVGSGGHHQRAHEEPHFPEADMPPVQIGEQDRGDVERHERDQPERGEKDKQVAIQGGEIEPGVLELQP